MVFRYVAHKEKNHAAEYCADLLAIFAMSHYRLFQMITFFLPSYLLTSVVFCYAVRSLPTMQKATSL